MSLFIGLISGLFGGLIGLSGGVILVPLMVRILSLAQHRVHGTSLIAVVGSGLSGAVAYAMNGSVEVSSALILALGASMTARIGVRYCTALPEWKLMRYFGFFLILMSVLLAGKPFFGIMAADPLAGLSKGIALAVIGLVTGFLSGLLGIGGGVLMVPAMVLVVGMSQHVAQGCSLICLIPAGAIGAYSHFRHGNIVTGVLPGLVAGIMVGAYLGGTFANLLPEFFLRAAFAVVLMFLGMDLIRQGKKIPDRCEGSS